MEKSKPCCYAAFLKAAKNSVVKNDSQDCFFQSRTMVIFCWAHCNRRFDIPNRGKQALSLQFPPPCLKDTWWISFSSRDNWDILKKKGDIFPPASHLSSSLEKTAKIVNRDNIGGKRDNSACISQGRRQQGHKGRQIGKSEHGADSNKVPIGAQLV